MAAAEPVGQVLDDAGKRGEPFVAGIETEIEGWVSKSITSGVAQEMSCVSLPWWASRAMISRGGAFGWLSRLAINNLVPEGGHAVSPGHLALIHRPIGPDEQVFRVLRRGRVDGAADAGRH